MKADRAALPAAFLFILLSVVAGAAPALQRMDGAQELYERAQRAYFELKSDAQLSGRVESWLRVVAAYTLVIDTYPQDPLVDDMIFITGGLYREMYDHFGLREYLGKSMDCYGQVLRDFPQSFLQQASLFAIGQMQEQQMLQPEAALAT